MNSGATHLGGLRWMLVLPANPPKTACISGASLWREGPFLSVPTELDLDRIFQQPAVRVAFHQNEAILLILEDITVHDVKVVLEHPRQFRLAEGSGQTCPRDLKAADDIQSWRAVKVPTLEARVEHQ